MGCLFLTCHVPGHPICVGVDDGLLAVVAMFVVAVRESCAAQRKCGDESSKHVELDKYMDIRALAPEDVLEFGKSRRFGRCRKGNDNNSTRLESVQSTITWYNRAGGHSSLSALIAPWSSTSSGVCQRTRTVEDMPVSRCQCRWHAISCLLKPGHRKEKKVGISQPRQQIEILGRFSRYVNSDRRGYSCSQSTNSILSTREYLRSLDPPKHMRCTCCRAWLAP